MLVDELRGQRESLSRLHMNRDWATLRRWIEKRVESGVEKLIKIGTSDSERNELAAECRVYRLILAQVEGAFNEVRG